MSSLLQHLENNEAVLLMYLADELPAEDRAEVEQMLATDGSLRASLDALRAVRADVVGILATADASRGDPSAAPAVRRVAREIHQWQARRFSPPPPSEPVSELRFPWWSYPLTTAAAILIAFVVWWGTQDGGPGETGQRQLTEAEQQFSDWETQIQRRREFGVVVREYAGRPPDGLDAVADVAAQLEQLAAAEQDDVAILFLRDTEEPSY